MSNACPLPQKNDLGAGLDELTDEAIARLADDLGVPREPAATLRARVVAAFNDDTIVDAAVAPTQPAPMILGDMKLGG